MPGKVLILTGAPASSSLDWDASVLLHDFTEPIARFAGSNPPSERGAVLTPPRGSPTSPARTEQVVWRSIPLRRVAFPTGFSQQQAGFLATFKPSPKFFTTAAVSFDASPPEHDETEVTAEEVVSQFYEHSLAVYGGIPSSQPAGSPDDSYLSAETSLDDTTATDSLGADHPPPPAALGNAAHLSDLDDIPGAAQLTRLEPQTVTVNLIIGVISVAASRTVKTRWGATKSLVEVLVGDETSAGFAVTFWLNGSPSDTTAEVLAGLRPQDVVLMRNVALHVFRKKVYGSSLRKDMTKVHLLHRRRLDADDVGGHYSASDLASVGKRTARRPPDPQLEKTAKVRDWVLAFVGTGYPRGGGQRDRQGKETGKGKDAKLGGAQAWRRWDLPPEDTQDV